MKLIEFILWFGNIDRFFIKKVFEPIAHWFQERTRKTNFFMAEICFIIIFIINLADTLKRTIFPLINSPFKNHEFISAVVLIISLALTRYAHKKENEFQENGRIIKRVRHRLLEEWMPDKLIIARLLFLLHSALSLPFLPQAIMKFEENSSLLVWNIWLHMFTAGFYFLACEPLPPDKVKEWQTEREANRLKLAEKNI